MAARLPDDRKEDVRRATDLVELVQRYIPLRKSGRSFKARCPFHRENTPSFVVYPDTQRFKCFGCGKSGDCFGWVMEKEAVTFPEALRMLAREAGIDLEPPSPEVEGQRRRKDAVYETAEWACRWFQRNLKGSAAAAYLKGRGLTGETARDWRLGYAPDGWQGIIDAAAAEGIGTGALEAAGLILPRRTGDGFYDRFRHRVMFPIADVRGRVIGFGARLLGDDKEQPKYLNTPETVIFDKGRTLYGLDQARDEALRDRSLLVMEGYMDVLMAHQHGLRTAVAGLGTAFTRDHAVLMGRFADRVVLVYDADAAGLRAADRALEVLFEQNLDCRVAVLPEGCDPCDLLVADGAAALTAVLDDARDLFDHVVEQARRAHDLATPGGVGAATDAILAFAVRVDDDVKRAWMVDRTAAVLGVPVDRIRARAHELAATARRQVVSEGADARARDAASAEEDPPPVPEAPADTGSSRERALLQAALSGPGLAARLAAEVDPSTFSSDDLARLAEAIVASTDEDGTANPSACAAALRGALADEVAALVAEASGMDPGSLGRQFEDCLAGHSYDRRLEEARRRFADARREGRLDEENRWLATLNRLMAERKRRPPASGRDG